MSRSLFRLGILFLPLAAQAQLDEPGTIFTPRVDLSTPRDALYRTEGTLEFGYVASSGNSEQETLTFDTEWVLRRGLWRHRLAATALSSSEDEETIRERYAATGQSDYTIGGANYIFGVLAYDKDRFSGIDYQTSEVLGYGRRVLDSPALELSLELGGGLKQIRYLEPVDGERATSEPIARTRGGFVWNFSDSSAFEQRLLYERGADTSLLEAETGLRLDLNELVFGRLSYVLRRNGDVPDERTNTDRYTTITLGVSL